MEKITLIIEKAADNEVWGRLTFGDNLIIESAPSMDLLQKKMKKLLLGFHQVSPTSVEFDVAYDLAAIFQQKKYLNLSEVASKLNINRSLLAQYASGRKFPSRSRAREIEKVFHDLGRDLLKVRVAIKGEKLKTASSARTKVKQKA